MNRRLDLIRSPKHREKFCRAVDKITGCRKAFGCKRGEVICPIALAVEVTLQNDMKNIPIGEGVRLAWRKALDPEAVKQIIKDVFFTPRKYYPEKTRDEIVDEVSIELKGRKY